MNMKGVRAGEPDLISSIFKHLSCLSELLNLKRRVLFSSPFCFLLVGYVGFGWFESALTKNLLWGFLISFALHLSKVYQSDLLNQLFNTSLLGAGIGPASTNRTSGWKFLILRILRLYWISAKTWILERLRLRPYIIRFSDSSATTIYWIRFHFPTFRTIVCIYYRFCDTDFENYGKFHINLSDQLYILVKVLSCLQ